MINLQIPCLSGRQAGKSQTNQKSKIQKIKNEFWKLFIGNCLLFVICLLYIGILPVFAQYNNTPDYQAQAEENSAISEFKETPNGKTNKQETPPNIEIDNLKARGVIEAEKGFCIKGDCKSSWPTLKCADFDSRPAGESGETFCKSVGKTCFAVFVGSGASFFNECSTLPVSAHKTRCCWVE